MPVFIFAKSLTTTSMKSRDVLHLRFSRVSREKLYGYFVEEAVPFFVDALQQSSTNPAKLMQLYSRVAHIRLTAGDQVLRAAEAVAKRLLEAYEQPPENPTTVIARYANG